MISGGGGLILINTFNINLINLLLNIRDRISQQPLEILEEE